MAKIQIMSDLHLDQDSDYGKKFVQSLDPSGVDIFILAGDIVPVEDINKNGAVAMARVLEICEKYPNVLFVPGNHEYWHNDRKDVDAFYLQLTKKIKNFHWLQTGDKFIYEDVTYIGDTMWFDEDPDKWWNEANGTDSKGLCGDETLMPDFHLIGSFKPWVYDQNKKFKKFLAEVKKNTDNYVIITHHAPSYDCVHSKWKGNALNKFFVSENWEIMYNDHNGFAPKVWIHGHMHDGHDRVLGNTRIICNPRGNAFEGKSRKGFKHKLIVEL